MSGVSSINYADNCPSFGRHSENKGRSTKGFGKSVTFNEKVEIIFAPNKDSEIARLENFRTDNSKCGGRRVSRCPNWEYPILSGIITGTANLLGGTIQGIGGFFFNDAYATEGLEKIKRGLVGILGGGPLLQQLDREVGKKTN